MKNLVNIVVIIVASISMVSCFNRERPNYEYMPNMYHPVPYEPYRGESTVFEDGHEAMLPVEGTIPRNWQPYDYENTNEGYELAKSELKNPLPYTEKNVNNGKQLYTIYCAVCHGDKGDGQGILATREKILGIPAYNDAGRAISEGSIYHVMYYGKNAMGSYASQTSEMERWQIDHYVLDLKAKLDGKPQRTTEDGEMGTMMDQEMEASNNEMNMESASENAQDTIVSKEN